MPDILVTTIPKNSKEQVCVQLSEFNGHNLISLRVFFDAGDGQMRPGKSGLAMRVESLGALIDALELAREEAIRRGLLPGAAT